MLAWRLSAPRFNLLTLNLRIFELPWLWNISQLLSTTLVINIIPIANMALTVTLTDFISELERDFTSLSHAQHLVSHPVFAAIQSHLDNPDPPKVLVLSFYGPTGVGKNFVSDIIADNLFRGKRRNKFVNTIIGPHHFPHWNNHGAYSLSYHALDTKISRESVCHCVGEILECILLTVNYWILIKLSLQFWLIKWRSISLWSRSLQSDLMIDSASRN